MKLPISSDRDFVLSNAQIIRALASGPSYQCGDCGSKMFVRRESGLCPRCYYGHTTVVEADAGEGRAQ